MPQNPDTAKAARVHKCGCELVHEPAQALADLLKAAVEVDEISDDVGRRYLGGFTIDERRRFDALRAAVGRLS